MSNYRLDEQKEKALVSWVKSASSGLETIWTFQDAWGTNKGVRPNTPFFALSISSGPRIVGGADIGNSGLDTWEYRRRKEFTLSVGVYARNGHLALLQRVVDSLDHASVLESFRSVGLFYLSHGTMQEISSFLETSTELRAMVDIFFAYKDSTIDTTKEIHSVELQFDYDVKKGGITIENQ